MNFTIRHETNRRIRLRLYCPKITPAQEEIMRLPLTVIDLKLMCDYMIREGYGERSVLLSNDTNESGYHGMYYGFGPEDESYTFITLN